MADRTKDRTKAVVDTSASEPASERTGEITAPLSAAEIAAELASSPAPDEGTAERTAEEAAKGTAEEEPTRLLPKTTAEAESGEDGAGGSADATAEDESGEDQAGGSADATAEAGTPDESDESDEPDEPDDVPAGLPEPLPVPQRHSGDRIGDRYRLEECISESPAFSSWRAVDEKLRRAVGVHLLAAGHQRAEDVLAAARSAALLGDPRFVRVLDAVQDGELVYVIREWLPGATDLATLLAPGPMEPYEAYQMVRQVTDAIAAAHRGGRSHLRLTPRTVLRTDTGQYRINGVAVDAALRGLTDRSEEDTALTDTRAIGALLYAALTHRWPHPEDRYDLRGLPKDLACLPPDQVRAGVHRGLSELAARALCTPPPHHLEPITTPAELAKAIALLPRIRQPEPELPPAGRPAPRYPSPQSAVSRVGAVRPPGPPAPGGPGSGQAYRPAPRRGRRRLKKVLQWTVSAVVLAAIGYGSWHLAGRLDDTGGGGRQALGTAGVGSAPSTAPSSAHPTPVAISDVSSFNPFGTGPMHVDQLAQSHDGDPGTAWQTDGYAEDLDIIGHGTGLLVDLGSTQAVSSLSVQFNGSTAAELRIPAAAGDTEPTKWDDFGSALAQSTGATADFRLATPVRSRYLLIWLTSLPKDGSGRYRGQVAEIKVSG